MSFDATLVDYDTTTFYPGADVYNDYIEAVALAANVSSTGGYVSITGINPGSVVVSTTVIAPTSTASTFTSKLKSGSMFDVDTFGEVTVSHIQTSGAATTTTSPVDDSGESCRPEQATLHVLLPGAPLCQFVSCGISPNHA